MKVLVVPIVASGHTWGIVLVGLRRGTLFPEDDLAVVDRGEYARFEYLFVLAHVEEYGVDRAAALASYRRLLGEFAAKKYNSSRAIKMAEQANAALRRLGG